MLLSFYFCKLLSKQEKSNSNNSYNINVTSLFRSKNNDENNNSLLLEFINLLEEITKECLDSEYKNDETVRNYAWFRQYMLTLSFLFLFFWCNVIILSGKRKCVDAEE